jgi:superfamily I DNA/RNA helicase
VAGTVRDVVLRWVGTERAPVLEDQAEAYRIFTEAVRGDEDRMLLQRELLGLLLSRRDPRINLHGWLLAIRNALLQSRFLGCRTLDDEAEVLQEFLNKTAPDGTASELMLGEFAGQGEGSDHLLLSTLHSAKGREFRVVILFGMDRGRIPWNNASQGQIREARRLFYVLLFSAGAVPS